MARSRLSLSGGGLFKNSGKKKLGRIAFGAFVAIIFIIFSLCGSSDVHIYHTVENVINMRHCLGVMVQYDVTWQFSVIQMFKKIFFFSATEALTGWGAFFLLLVGEELCRMIA